MTMMRTRGELRHAEWVRLFHEYLHGQMKRPAAVVKSAHLHAPSDLLNWLKESNTYFTLRQSSKD